MDLLELATHLCRLLELPDGSGSMDILQAVAGLDWGNQEWERAFDEGFRESWVLVDEVLDKAGIPRKEERNGYTIRYSLLDRIEALALPPEQRTAYLEGTIDSIKGIGPRKDKGHEQAGEAQVEGSAGPGDLDPVMG